MKGKLVIFGAWYFSDVVAELAMEQGWEVLGRIDPEPPEHVETLKEMPDDVSCFVAIGDNSIRRYVTEKLLSKSRKIISLIHSTASVSQSATIGSGSYVGEHSVLRTKSALGRGIIVNAGAVVSHHSWISDFVLLGPNSAIGSRVKVGPESLVGIGACVHPCSEIGKKCTIGAGAVVIGDISSEATVIGNPATLIRVGNRGMWVKQSDWSNNFLW